MRMMCIVPILATLMIIPNEVVSSEVLVKFEAKFKSDLDERKSQESLVTTNNFQTFLTHLHHVKELQEDEFVESIRQTIGNEAPNEEELVKMFSDLSKGNIPDYINKNNYELLGNSSGWYSYDYGHDGNSNDYTYVQFPIDGSQSTFSVLQFNFVNGTITGFEYSGGQAYFVNVRYTDAIGSYVWETSTYGINIHRGDSGYVTDGVYTAATQGISNCKDGQQFEYLSNTVSSVNRSYYKSMGIENIKGMFNSKNFTVEFDNFSITGGTNSSKSISGVNNEDGTLFSKGNMKLRHKGKEYTFDVESNHHHQGTINTTEVCNVKNFLRITFIHLTVAGNFIPEHISK